MLLSGKGSDDRDTGQNLSGYQIHAVDQFLHHFEFWHRKFHQYQYHTNNHGNCHKDDPTHRGIGTCYHNDTANGKHRCVQDQTQQHDLDHLHLLDIVGTTCDQRCGRELIDLLARIGNHTGIYLLSQTASDIGCGSRRNKAKQNGCTQHAQSHQDHNTAGMQKIIHLHLVHIIAKCLIFFFYHGNRHLLCHGISQIAKFLRNSCPHLIQRRWG